MNINEKIKQARLSCGLSDVELASDLEITISEYMDIEFHEDELASVVDLHVVRQLCQILHLDAYDLLGIPKGDTCPTDQKRNELIISKMENLGISNEELADQIGFEVVAIEEMRADPDFFETWTVDLIKELAGALQLPIQSLLRL
ncbi:MAG: hypothetical protein ABI618_10815 [Nitrospirota bacterium]